MSNGIIKAEKCRSEQFYRNAYDTNKALTKHFTQGLKKGPEFQWCILSPAVTIIVLKIQAIHLMQQYPVKL